MIQPPEPSHDPLFSPIDQSGDHTRVQQFMPVDIQNNPRVPIQHFEIGAWFSLEFGSSDLFIFGHKFIAYQLILPFQISKLSKANLKDLSKKED
jgi:hypothetical protein